MNTIDAIMSRISVRKFTDQEIPEDAVRTILEAGMAGPSAVNARPFTFLVVKDPETLRKIADVNGAAAKLLAGAKMGIVVCADMKRSFEKAPMYTAVDTSIATENMILAAWDLGIGSCWLGTWPQPEKYEAQQALLGLPDDIVPHHIVAFGYPAQDTKVTKQKWEEDKVHYEKW